MTHTLRKFLPDAAAVALFALLSTVYFIVPLSDGLTLSGHDNTAGIGANRERAEWNKNHDEPTYWTNSLFGGMPTYQLSPSYPSGAVTKGLQKVLGLGMPQLLTYVFLMLLGAYIMLRAFDFRVWLAALGAIAWAFSSYFFIIIAAGHLWKVYALAYLPPLIGGVMLCMRGRLLPGAVVTALFSALEIYSNHPQMTYYFLPVVAVVTLCSASGGWRVAAKRLAVAVAAGLLGVAVNITSLYHTYEYSKHTMRGGSELSGGASDGAATNADGLDREYITQWSYGLDETWSLLVPKINGGSSMDALTSDGTAMSKANPMYRPVYQSLRQYFGDQPFTAGPVYVGAIVLMLAILGLIVCRGPMKWGLLALTALSVMLSWGHNFMWFTDLFIDYVPMYSKFRTVSSILVVAEFCIPLLAMLGLREWLREPRLKPILIAAGVTGFCALAIAVCPDVFVTRFVSAQEQAMLNQAASAGYIPSEMLAPIVANLTAMREAVVSADAWRSLGFIVAGAVVTMLMTRLKGNSAYMRALGAALIVLCLADMWTVNKRYLNDSMFSKPHSIEQSFARTAVDDHILADDALDYRVLNLAGDTFNENETSYWHKSVGGYSAVKMQRYQDIIDHCLRPQIGAYYDALMSDTEDSLYRSYDVINMLNTRWVIVPARDGERIPIMNEHAMGNAWLVGDVRFAATADEELEALSDIDPRRTAVVRDGDLTAPLSLSADNSSITLREYAPNRLTYDVNAAADCLAVLSEVWYPGWTATLDNEQTPVLRANYILRAVTIKPGHHTLTLTFDPPTIHTTETIAWCAWALILALTLWTLYRARKHLKN